MADYFFGSILLEPLPDNRKMLMHSDFGYMDRRGAAWLAPSGSIVDGASIPQEFWSLVGGPFEGAQRVASVLHDVACQDRNRPWQSVHRMFYEACLRAGLDPIRARIFYAALQLRGPRWTPDGILMAVQDELDPGAVHEIARVASRQDVELEELERLVPV